MKSSEEVEALLSGALSIQSVPTVESIRLPITSASMAERIDKEETNRVNQEILKILGMLPQIIAKLRLSGKWGFLLLALVSSAPLVVNFILQSQDRPVLNWQNLLLAIQGIITSMTLSPAHSASAVVSYSEQARQTMTGPLAITVTRNLQLEGSEVLARHLEIESKKTDKILAKIKAVEIRLKDSVGSSASTGIMPGTLALSIM